MPGRLGGRGSPPRRPGGLALAAAALLLLAAGARGLSDVSDVSGAIGAPLLSPFGASSPFELGLGWPGVGDFGLDVSTPSLLGLALGPGDLPDLDGSGSGSGSGWANLTLPAPLVISYRAALVLAPAEGLARSLVSEVMYNATGVQVALQLAQSQANATCLVVLQAVVQVGSAVRSAQCAGNGCPPGSNSTSEVGVDPASLARAIAETLTTSPEVLQMLNLEGCEGLDLEPKAFLLDALPEGIPAEPRSFLLIAVVLLVLLVLGVLSAVGLCGCCMGCCCWRNSEESDKEREFLDHCHSLLRTDTLPLWSRVAFFVLVIANIAFFVSANISVGAEINIDYTSEGVFVDLPPVYDFSMLNSTIEMLKAGVYLLGFILLGFSVFWPYIKLFILSAMFCLPSPWVRPARRASVMEWIDTLGKWSMFDVFALCACMVIFLVELQSPATVLYPLGWWGITLSMTPVWGMYANLIAQIMSQFLSVFALWAHHRAYKADWHTFHGDSPLLTSNTAADALKSKLEPTQQGDNGEKGQLAKGEGPPPMPPGAVMGQEIRSGLDGSAVLRPNLLARLLVALMLVAAIGLVVSGFFVTGFTVRVVGLLGLVQELAIPGSSTRYFTPLYVAMEMTTVIPPGQPGIAIGTYALSIMLVACVLVVPVAQASVLLAVWALPMPLPRLKSVLKANELLASWQYIEVYLIAVIVGCLQIPVVCALLVGDSCDSLQEELDALVEAGVISHATCFSMAPKVYAGLWFLFFGSILLYAASVVVRETAYSVVNTYDPFRAAHARELTRQQAVYYSRRMRVLRFLWLVEPCDGTAEAAAVLSLPVASPTAAI